MIQSDRCVIVVKAQPHRSSKYAETVCVAGVGEDGIWRRQYPVMFRILDEQKKFRRWDWISYDFVPPEHDKRRESQKVVPETIKLSGRLKRNERAGLLDPIVRDSFEEANSLGESLTLIRPAEIDFHWAKKSIMELDSERVKHRELADQLSFFDKTAEPLEPCPYQFKLKWKAASGKTHKHESDDWESAAAFKKFQRLYGEEKALVALKEIYEDQYMKAGLALAFSTHKLRNVTHNTANQWLLVGLIRLDEQLTQDMFR